MMHSLTVCTDWTMISQVGGAMISERWSRHRVGHQWEGVFVMQCRVLISDDDMTDPLENAGSHCVSRAVGTLRTHSLNDHNLQMEALLGGEPAQGHATPGGSCQLRAPLSGRDQNKG